MRGCEDTQMRGCEDARSYPLVRPVDRSDGELLFGAANPADSASAVGAFAFRNGLAVFRRACHGVFHCLLRLAFHAVCFHRPSLSIRNNFNSVMFA